MATQSFWQRTASAPNPYSELPGSADVVIVGGGSLGTAAAYWAARAGLKAVLIEQTKLAAGATGRNGGFITLGAADSYLSVSEKYGRQTAQAIWRYTLHNRDLVQQVIADEGFDFDYRMCGTITLALDNDEAQSLRANIDALEADGIHGETIWHDHVGAQSLVKTQLSEEIEGCVFKPGTALIHSAKYVFGLAHAAVRRGARISIAKFLSVDGDATGVTVRTNIGSVRARAAILAGNAWTDELVPALKGIVVPVRGQVLSYLPSARVFDSGMGASITPTGEYWQQTLNGSILIGGCRADAPDREWNIREDALRDVVQAPLENVIPRLFPQLNNLTVEQRWSGPMAFTRDYLPVIDRAPGLANTWVAGGFNGHGMCYGLVTGEALVDAVMHDRKPASLSPFAADRAHLRTEADE